MTTEKEVNDAAWEGAIAAEEGLSVNDNPYIEGSERWKLWLYGFLKEKDNDDL